MRRSDFAKSFPGKLVSTAHDSVAFVPAPLHPKLNFSDDIIFSDDIVQWNEVALLALGELRAIIPSLPNPTLVTTPFLRREAVLSSKIEGMHTEIEGLFLYEAAQAEKQSAAETDEDSQDAREVFNYVVALKYGIEQIKKLPICNRILKGMHKRLMDGVRDDRGKYKLPGKFRKSQAFIGSSLIQNARYVAPPEDRVEDLMSDLETYINGQVSMPSLVNIALIHYQFESIHPFSDGNGRVGRLLIMLLFIAKKILPEPLLYLSAYFERHRDEYPQRLWEVSQRGAWGEWIVFFLQGVEHEALDAAHRARQLLNLREKYRTEFQSKRGSASLLELVDCLFRWPVITVKQAAEHLKMTYQGAQNNVLKLEDRGLLTEVTGDLRKKRYLAHPIIKLMS